MSQLPDNQSQEGNFLDLLKSKLNSVGLLDALKDPKITTLVDETIPAWVGEFAGYIGATNTLIPALHAPDDYTKAQDAQAQMQRQLDRLTRCYVDHLPVYQSLQQSHKLANYYIQVEVNEVKALKNADMRSAAINYVLDDYTEALAALDMLYDTISQVRTHIEKANLGLNMQLRLVEGRHFSIHGASRGLGGSH
jgi:hypothetical protein